VAVQPDDLPAEVLQALQLGRHDPARERALAELAADIDRAIITGPVPVPDPAPFSLADLEALTRRLQLADQPVTVVVAVEDADEVRARLGREVLGRPVQVLGSPIVEPRQALVMDPAGGLG
jgi:hypothetical protein